MTTTTRFYVNDTAEDLSYGPYTSKASATQAARRMLTDDLNLTRRLQQSPPAQPQFVERTLDRMLRVQGFSITRRPVCDAITCHNCGEEFYSTVRYEDACKACLREHARGCRRGHGGARFGA